MKLVLYLPRIKNLFNVAKAWCAFCLTICCVPLCSAQDIRVTGVLVSDTTDTNVYYIDVVQDNVSKRTLKMEQPEFVVTLDKNDFPCNLLFRKDGFQTLVTSLTEASEGLVELGPLRLMPLSRLLNDVVVVSKRPMVSTKNGTINVRVEGTSLESMGGLTDMMEYVPGLVSRNGKIEVFGRGEPLYLLNGVEVKDESLISSLRSEQIKKIEIDKHPSSAYPSGTRAVVNIVTKTMVKDDLSVKVASDLTVKRKVGAGSSVFVSYKKNKLLMNLSYSFSDRGNLNKETYYRDIISPSRTFNSEWQREDYSVSKYHNFNYSLDYDLSENHKLGLNYLFSHSNETNDITGHDTENSSLNDVVERDVAIVGHNGNNRHLVNMHWNGRLSDNSTLSFTQDIVMNTKEMKDDVNENDVRTHSLLHNSTDNSYSSDIYTSNLKYNNKDIRSVDCTFGVRYDYFKTCMESGVFDVVKGVNRNNNNSKSIENIYSAFGEATKEWDRFSLTLGLRYEYLRRSVSSQSADITGTDRSDASDGGLFPQLSIEYNPNDKLSFSLFYETDKENPMLSMLNTGTIYKDSLTYERGNVNIRPSYTHSVSFEMDWAPLTFGVDYTYTKDYIITPYVQEDSESDIVVSYPVNLDAVRELCLTLGFYKTWNKWSFDLNACEFFPYSKIMYLGEMKEMKKPQTYGRAKLSFELSKKMSFFTQFVYQGSSESIDYVQKALNKWDVGMTGVIGGLTYSLSFNDILHCAHYNNAYSIYQNVKDGTYGTNDFRGVRMALSYRLFSKERMIRNRTANYDLINRL